MSVALQHAEGDFRKSHPVARADSYESIQREVCAKVFAALPRSDQRRKGAEYVQGLLNAKGRKSIRNIAALLGGQANEQGLHHFVSSSTWSWMPVRRALARYLEHIAAPQAWVIRPMIIPKTGDNSVGVGRRFFPTLGQVVSAQESAGVWAASDTLTAPVNFRLHLSNAWLMNDSRKRTAAIPEHIRPESLGQCAVEAYLAMMADWDLPPRPIVLDAREVDAGNAVRRFRAADVPVLTRIPGTLPLRVTNFAPHRRGADIPADRVMRTVSDLRRPVLWHGSEPSGPALPRRLAATVPVRLAQHWPGGAAARDGELLLLGIGRTGQDWPAELWLTDLTTTPVAELVRMTSLLDRVDRDFAQIADHAGIRDFAGRSFGGWHRHVTLASVAHAVAALVAHGERSLRHTLS